MILKPIDHWLRSESMGGIHLGLLGDKGETRNTGTQNEGACLPYYFKMIPNHKVLAMQELSEVFAVQSVSCV